jgi:hypothetical protein
MEWVMLVLLVPAIVIPVVLLFGFAGCGAYLGSGPTPPVITSATPVDPATVRLDWTFASGVSASFQVRREKGSAGPADIVPSDTSPFIDSGLDAATEYTYQVRAVQLVDGAPSDWSAAATIQTWARAFTAGLEQAGADRSATGACVVQRVGAGNLSQRGNLVGVTVRAASNGNLLLSRVTISRPALVGNEFDSAAKPVDVAAAVQLTAGQSVPLPPVPFDVSANEDLLVAFDVATPGAGRFVAGVPHTTYLKEPPPGGQITEAGTQNRAGFVTRPDELWFIDAIDVATKWPPLS